PQPTSGAWCRALGRAPAWLRARRGSRPSSGARGGLLAPALLAVDSVLRAHEEPVEVAAPEKVVPDEVVEHRAVVQCGRTDAPAEFRHPDEVRVAGGPLLEHLQQRGRPAVVSGPPADQDVAAGLAVQLVEPVAADQQVPPAAGEELVVAGPAEQDAVAAPAPQLVGSGTAVEHGLDLDGR